PGPVQVSGLTESVIGVSVGGDSACAITAGGALECWGFNLHGELGNGSIASSSVPMPVSGLTGTVSGASVGYQFGCAVAGAGGIECWGDNSFGQLGNGSMTSSLVPVPVSGRKAIAVSAGETSACAVTAAGGVECWGSNPAGSSVPVDVSGITSGATSVSTGSNFACATLGSGDVMCWGSNEFGQLGNNSTTASSTPVPASPL